MLYLDGIGISFLVKEIKEKILRYKIKKFFNMTEIHFHFFLEKII